MFYVDTMSGTALATRLGVVPSVVPRVECEAVRALPGIRRRATVRTRGVGVPGVVGATDVGFVGGGERSRRSSRRSARVRRGAPLPPPPRPPRGRASRATTATTSVIVHASNGRQRSWPVRSCNHVLVFMGSCPFASAAQLMGLDVRIEG